MKKYPSPLNTVTLAAIILSTFGLSISQAPPVILTHDLGSRAIAYHGQTVIFTCTVNIVMDRDILITWRSEDYIGTGGDVLQVTSDNPVGTTVNQSTTIVTLTDHTRNNGITTIITQLELVASAMYPDSRVSCKPNGFVRVISTFEVHPPVILTYNLGSDATAYSGQRVTFRCTVKIVVDLGIVITWRSEDYIGRGDVLQLTSDDPAGTTVNKLTTMVTLISSTRSSDGLTTVITELQLTADAMYANSHVSCMANGGFIRGVPFFTSRSLLPATTTMTELQSDATVTSTIEPTLKNSNSNSALIGSTVGSIVPLVVLLIVAIINLY